MEQKQILFNDQNSPFEEFSNYFPTKFELREKQWATTEHYFQAMKFAGTEHEQNIRNAETPEDAKKLGYTREFPLRTDWQEVKYDIMKEAQLAKFSQNYELFEKLLSTGNSEIVYNNPKDNLWGIGDGSGKNLLGQILVEIRNVICQDQELQQKFQRNQKRKVSLEKAKFSTGSFFKKQDANINDNYELMEEIGNGAFGLVQKARNLKTNQMRAVKSIFKDQVEIIDGNQQQFFREVEVLKDLDHPNIVRLFELYEDEEFYYLVTELCEGGELFERVQQQKNLTEQQAANIMLQLLSAISYCQFRQIVHRDIKPENLLLENTSIDSSIKLIDFGTSRYFNQRERLKSLQGSPYYVAPEVIERNYGPECDIWSAGILLYLLLCGHPPFQGKTTSEIMTQVKTGVINMTESEWDIISDDAKDLIQKMININAAQRLSAQQCIEHPWIQQNLSSQPKQEVVLKSLQNLNTFRSKFKLRTAVMLYMADQLTTHDELQELKKVFHSLDINKDGEISTEDLIQNSGMLKNQIEQVIASIDINNDGSINFSEFIVAASDRQKLLSKEKIQTCFEMLDQDGSGTITIQELQKVLGNNEDFDIETMKELVKEIDQNGDEEIDLNEFKSMLLDNIL